MSIKVPNANPLIVEAEMKRNATARESWKKREAARAPRAAESTTAGKNSPTNKTRLNE
ncbi:MAG: hypothetical protein ACE5KO_02370 [Candidatus Bathyarchaeia archaeon]